MILTMYNGKGGVGKTTNTMHVGAALAKLGHSVLLIDFDPQISLTECCGIEDSTYTIKNLLDGTGTPLLRKRSENYTVLAGSIDLHASDYKADSLKKIIKNWNSSYEYIIIDCPPTHLNEKELTLPEIALNACSQFIIPLTPSFTPVKNAFKVLDSILAIVKPNNQNIKFFGFFFCLVQSAATKKNGIFFDKIKSKAPDFLFESTIRQDVEIEYASWEGKTIFQHKPNSNSGNDFIELSKEIIKRYKDGKK